MTQTASKIRTPWNKGIKTGPNPKHSLFMSNRTLSEETKEKISKSLKGIVRGKMSVEQKEKISTSKKGKIAGDKHPFFGKKHSDSCRAVMKINRFGLGKGERNNNWAGDDVEYRALHHWVNRELGRPTTCVHCEKTGLKGKEIHWANKDHKYRRNINDWIRLCAGCHKKFDQFLNKTQIYEQ